MLQSLGAGLWRTWPFTPGGRTCREIYYTRRPSAAPAYRLFILVKSITNSSKGAPLKLCKVPNEATQLNLLDQFITKKTNEKDQANTPLNKISTDSNPNTLTYGPILNKYLDPETVRWGELISKYRWENGNRSDDEIERKRSTLSHNA